MGSMSGWHVLIIAVVLFGFGALVFFMFKSKMKWPTSRILKAIGGIVVALIFIIISDSYVAESSDVTERSLSQARENVSNYTESKRISVERYISMFAVNGYILEICVNDMDYGAKSVLFKYKKNIEKLVGMLKSDGHIDDDMIIDANAIAKGAIDATRGGKIRESDCDGAISYLGSIGMLNELN